jgi:hypothetical protein
LDLRIIAGRMCSLSLALTGCLLSSREVLRQKVPPGLFFAFNILFISLAQSILLFLVTTPAYVFLLVERLDEPFGAFDNTFPKILLGLVLVEWFADKQQWGMFFQSILSGKRNRR